VLAMRTAKEGGSLLPPKHILNSPTKLMKQEGYGGGYEYDHGHADAFSGQDYFPKALGRPNLLRPARTVVLSARSGKGWIIGPNCAGSGVVSQPVPSPIYTEFTVTIRGIWATQRLRSFSFDPFSTADKSTQSAQA